jgi:hypothetical protein
VEHSREASVVDTSSLTEVVQKEHPTPEERAEVAKWLKSVGGCPHLNKWHNPGYADTFMKCLDCDAERV